MLDDFGDQIISSGGAASNTTINSGGAQNVESGGVAFNTTVSSGGFEEVASGGTAVNAMVDGGIVQLGSGAVVSGAIFFSGVSTLAIVGSAMQSATISGFSTRDIIDLASIASGTAGTAFITSSGILDVEMKSVFPAMSPEAPGLFIRYKVRQYLSRFEIVASTWREDGHGPEDDAHRQVAGAEKPG
jgi:autotransporter passenger strand-loop-strand repeat protein